MTGSSWHLYQLKSVNISTILSIAVMIRASTLAEEVRPKTSNEGYIGVGAVEAVVCLMNRI